VRFTAITQVGEVITCTGSVTEKLEAGGERAAPATSRPPTHNGQVKLAGEAVVACPERPPDSRRLPSMNPRKLQGKVALVSGSGRGIGREIALKLASEGASVVVNDLDAEPAQQTVAEIGCRWPGGGLHAGSVTEAGFAERFVAARSTPGAAWTSSSTTPATPGTTWCRR
jgi:hypothetical protein